MTDKNVMVVGAGFVNGTLYEVLHEMKGWNFFAYDKDPENSYLAKRLGFDCVNWIWLSAVKGMDLVFVAVPTPMDKKTGECHVGIVEEVVANIREHNPDVWICIKSTVPPGTTKRLHEKYGNVCFNPEFLTEAHAFHDFEKQGYQIIGYAETIPGVIDSLDCPLDDFFREAADQGLILGPGNVFSISSTAAEMVKYTRNCYLATRLSFFNEIKQICDKIEVDYRHMMAFVGIDRRVGHHYSMVEDGEEGWGKSCLPKDLNALMHFAKEHGVDPKVMSAVWQKNLEVVAHHKRDWDKMEGRAVISQETSDPRQLSFDF